MFKEVDIMANESGSGKAIGIDLGTTFSAVAVMEAGKPVIIPNSEGERTTPSVVHIKNGEVVVGSHALNQLIVDPKHTIRSIKRKMGTSEKVEIDGKEYTPQEISAMILKKLKSDAEAYLGTKVTDAVITVPAYFNDSQRQATKDAGKIAGLNVLRIINEPTAASLAYGLNNSNDHTILVFDFGGGTFDVSILEIGDGVFEVKATSGDNHLGGDDIDRAIMDWTMKKFKEDNGIDLSSDLNAVQRLRDAAEKAKKELSTKLKTELNIPYITATQEGPKHLNYELTRAEFEHLIADILERLKKPVETVLADAHLKPEDIDDVILVGGSTRIPAVQNLVKDILKKEPKKSVNPDEAVALGAAIQCGVIKGETKDILLLDVTPLSLGIETLGGIFTKMIEKNTTIPTKKTKIFSTAEDNQTAVTINVYQGERKFARDNHFLGSFDLTGIPPAPRGVPQIEVTFNIDVNGIVSVSAKDKATGKEQSIKITGSTNLSEEEIERMRKEAEQHAKEDEEKAKKVETENKAEQIVYQTQKTLDEFKDKIPEDLKKKIEEKMNALKEGIGKDDVSTLEKKMDELNKVVSEIGAKMYGNAAGGNTAGQSSQSSQSGDDVKADFKKKE